MTGEPEYKSVHYVALAQLKGMITLEDAGMSHSRAGRGMFRRAKELGFEGKTRKDVIDAIAAEMKTRLPTEEITHDPR